MASQFAGRASRVRAYDISRRAAQFRPVGRAIAGQPVTASALGVDSATVKKLVVVGAE